MRSSFLHFIRYEKTETELKINVSNGLNFSALYQDKDLLPDTPISLGFYNRSGLPTVTVERALKVAVEDTIQEEEVKMDEQSEAAIAHIKSTEGQLLHFVEDGILQKRSSSLESYYLPWGTSPNGTPNGTRPSSPISGTSTETANETKVPIDAR